MRTLSLVIPVYNEAGNLLPLAERLDSLVPAGLAEVVWVNNGSQDGSGEELARIVCRHPWSRLVSLARNQGYGGGVQAGIAASRTGVDHIGWIPADGQIGVEDLRRIWSEVETTPHCVHKGLRVQREDSQRRVSKVYSALCRRILGLSVADINGLPKILPAELAKRIALQIPSARGFVFDAETLLLAQRAGASIREHAVVSRPRTHGKSSWSGRRLRTYWEVFTALLLLRSERA